VQAHSEAAVVEVASAVDPHCGVDAEVVELDLTRAAATVAADGVAVVAGLCPVHQSVPADLLLAHQPRVEEEPREADRTLREVEADRAVPDCAPLADGSVGEVAPLLVANADARRVDVGRGVAEVARGGSRALAAPRLAGSTPRSRQVETSVAGLALEPCRHRGHPRANITEGAVGSHQPKTHRVEGTALVADRVLGTAEEALVAITDAHPTNQRVGRLAGPAAGHPAARTGRRASQAGQGAGVIVGGGGTEGKVRAGQQRRVEGISGHAAAATAVDQAGEATWGTGSTSPAHEEEGVGAGFAINRRGRGVAGLAAGQEGAADHADAIALEFVVVGVADAGPGPEGEGGLAEEAAEFVGAGGAGRGAADAGGGAEEVVTGLAGETLHRNDGRVGGVVEGDVGVAIYAVDVHPGVGLAVVQKLAGAPHVLEPHRTV
jgi:hypothetical protein